MSSNDNFEKKYLKYKNKYIELKNNYTNINQKGGFAPISDLTEHLQKTDNRLTKLEQGQSNIEQLNQRVDQSTVGLANLKLVETNSNRIEEVQKRVNQITFKLATQMGVQKKKIAQLEDEVKRLNQQLNNSSSNKDSRAIENAMSTIRGIRS